MSGSARAPWRIRWARLGVVAAIVALVLSLVLYSVAPRNRSYAVQTSTRGLEVAFEGRANNMWRLEDAGVCIRVARRAMPEDAVANRAGCDARFFEFVAADVLEIGWGTGDRVRVTRPGADRGPEILVLETGDRPVSVAGHVLTVNSRIQLGNAAWNRGNTLTWAGKAVVGQMPGPGGQFNLIGGVYSVSEQQPWGGEVAAIYEGALLSGDEVRVVDNTRCRDGEVCRAPIDVFGFIEPRPSQEAGMGASLYSPVGDAVLEINRYGAVTIHDGPSWTDRALNNQPLLAFSAILALVGALMSVLLPLRWVVALGTPGAADLREGREQASVSGVGPAVANANDAGGAGA